MKRRNFFGLLAAAFICPIQKSREKLAELESRFRVYRDRDFIGIHTITAPTGKIFKLKMVDIPAADYSNQPKTMSLTWKPTYKFKG